MPTNETRRELLNRAKAAGYPGSITEVFQAADQGIDLIEQHQMQQQQQEMQVAQTPQEQEVGLREEHAAGNTQASMAFPDVQPNQSFNTVGMQAPIDIQKIDNQGHLVESYKNVPPGIQDLPTGPSEGTIIESPAAYQKGGVKLPEVTVKGNDDPFKYPGMTGGQGGDGYTNTDYVNETSYVNEVLPTKEQFNRTKSFLLKDKAETKNFDDSLYMALLSQNYASVLQPKIYDAGNKLDKRRRYKQQYKQGIKPADHMYTSLSLNRLFSDSDLNNPSKDHPDFVYEDVPKNTVDLMRNYHNIGYSTEGRKILNRTDIERRIQTSNIPIELDPNKRYSAADSPGGDIDLYVPYHSYPKGKQKQSPALVVPKRKQEKIIKISPKSTELLPVSKKEKPASKKVDMPKIKSLKDRVKDVSFSYNNYGGADDADVMDKHGRYFTLTLKDGSTMRLAPETYRNYFGTESLMTPGKELRVFDHLKRKKQTGGFKLSMGKEGNFNCIPGSGSGCGSIESALQLKPNLDFTYNTGNKFVGAQAGANLQTYIGGFDTRSGAPIIQGGVRGGYSMDPSNENLDFQKTLEATGKIAFKKRNMEGAHDWSSFNPGYEAGVYGNYDLINKNVKDVGVFGGYGPLELNVGYDLQNKQIKGGLGLRFGKKQTGGYKSYDLLDINKKQNEKDARNLFLQRQRYAESTFDPKAVSPAGALGIAQFMPITIGDMKKKGMVKNNFDPFNAAQATNAQNKWMDYLSKRPYINKGTDEVKLAKQLAGYNMGGPKLNSVLTAMKKDGINIYDDLHWVDKLPEYYLDKKTGEPITETTDYINKILNKTNPTFERDFEKATTTEFFKPKRTGGLKTTISDLKNTGKEVKEYYDNYTNPVFINSKNLNLNANLNPFKKSLSLNTKYTPTKNTTFTGGVKFSPGSGPQYTAGLNYRFKRGGLKKCRYGCY